MGMWRGKDLVPPFLKDRELFSKQRRVKHTRGKKLIMEKNDPFQDRMREASRKDNESQLRAGFINRMLLWTSDVWFPLQHLSPSVGIPDPAFPSNEGQ